MDVGIVCTYMYALSDSARGHITLDRRSISLATPASVSPFALEYMVKGGGRPTAE
jgi:hypothetical protein